MPRIADRVKITKKFVDSLEPPGSDEVQDRIIWDSEVPGFGVRVRGDGPSVYVVRYRHNGRNRRMAIDPVGAITPAEARTAALALLGDHARGIDPLRERQAAKVRGVKMKDFAKTYLKRHAEVHKKPHCAHHDALNIKKHIDPALGNIEVQEVTRRQVVNLHHKMAKTPGAANRILALLSKMFSCAVVWGLREDNPVRGVPRYPEKKRSRFLSDAELARLGKALREAEQKKTEAPSVIALFRLLVLTGCRAGEILRLQWPQVDFKAGTIELLDGKTGDRRIPMNAPTRKLLAKLHGARGTSPWVIKGRRIDRPLTSYTRPWQRICIAAELQDVRVHDLRHSNASIGAAAGLSLPVIGAMLGHKSPLTTDRYAHLSDDPIRKASDLVGEKIAAALEARSNRADQEQRSASA